MSTPPHRTLRYFTDSTPGIRRHRRKQRGQTSPSFFYTHADGRRVTQRATLDRIRMLAIPPAYEDVWICPHSLGHLQATGRDARGRKQYRYHALWRAAKDDIKHAKMHEFGRMLPALRRTLRTDLAKPGLPRDKVLALVLSLMDATCVRVGNEEYARTNGSFGLTTLQDRHARFGRNGHATLKFPGKGGTPHEVPIGEARLAALVRKCQHLPGQRLFQYRGEDGQSHAIDSTQLNAYLHQHLGNGFTAKDFRTWHATLSAYRLLQKSPRPDPCTDRACQRRLKEVVAEVASQLRNTPAVCRKSYINPLVLEAWRQGEAPFNAHRPRAQGVDPLLSLLRRSSRPHPAPAAPPAPHLD